MYSESIWCDEMKDLGYIVCRNLELTFFRYGFDES